MPPLHTGTPWESPSWAPEQGLSHAGRAGCEEAAWPCSDPALLLQLLLGCAPANPWNCSADAAALCSAGTQLSARSLHRWVRPSEFIPAFLNLQDDEHRSSAVGVY